MPQGAIGCEVGDLWTGNSKARSSESVRQVREGLQDDSEQVRSEVRSRCQSRRKETKADGSVADEATGMGSACSGWRAGDCCNRSAEDKCADGCSDCDVRV